MSKSSQTPKATKPPGQPTKYRKEYCERIVASGKKGETVEMFADSLDIHKDTIYEWAKIHKEFSDALRRARQAQEAFMQKVGLNGVMGKIKGFNGGTWAFWMKVRFRYNDNLEPTEEPIDELTFNE